ncbi:T9SS C-terminal target domain-containing protein [Candidatus Parcubacteria bacterium]|jgi:hypothetical protein|nr:MAG: T9SS C-terminal target domain-containing protein [Candidatus Parcubacteria bacterium]
MKRIVLFAVLFVVFTTLNFAQSPLPTLTGYENLSDKGVALSDTAQEGKSFKFWMNTSVATGNRYTKWEVALSQSVTFPKGSKISANIMIPDPLGDVQISVTLLNGDNVVMNSALEVESKNTGSSLAFHRKSFRFPEIDGSFNKIRLNLSYVQNESGLRNLFIDGVYLVDGVTETLIDNCNGNGGGTIVKPGVSTLTAPINSATNVSVTPRFDYGSVTNTTLYQLQIMKKLDGSIIYDQKNASTSVTLTAPLSYNTQYDWRVRCWNNDTSSDNWSETFSFTTASQVVSVPIFTVNSRSESDNSITLNWVGGEVEFQLMNMSGTVLQNPSANISPYTFSGLADGDYQLRGRFKNPQSDWSETYIFKVKVQVTLSVPIIGTPGNNSTGNPIQTVLSFTGNASEYEIMIAKNSEFTADVHTYIISTSPYALPNLSPSTTYYLKMRGKSGANYSEYTSVVNFMTVGVTGVEDNQVPSDFSLAQNYPNPFNPSTLIQFSLPANSLVRISIFDILGREVKQLTNQEFSGGVHSIRFDGEGISSGTYIYMIQTKFGQLSRKMNLVK